MLLDPTLTNSELSRHRNDGATLDAKRRSNFLRTLACRDALVRLAVAPLNANDTMSHKICVRHVAVVFPEATQLIDGAVAMNNVGIESTFGNRRESTTLHCASEG